MSCGTGIGRHKIGGCLERPKPCAGGEKGDRLPNKFNARATYEYCKQNIGPRVLWLIDYVKRKFREHRAKYENENAQDRAARRTANATWVIAIFAIAAAAVGYFTLRAVQGQLDEMRAEKRPWVSVNVTPTGPITKANGETWLPVQIELKNTGEDAAVDVFAFAQIYPPLSGIDADKQGVNFFDCKSILVEPGTGIALFPQETVEKAGQAVMPNGIKPTVFPDEPFWKGTLTVCLCYRTASRLENPHITSKLYVMNASSDKSGISLIAVSTDAN